MGTESIRTPARMALMSMTLGITSCMLVIIPFIILQRLGRYHWIASSVVLLWFVSFFCALWGSALAVNAQKENKLEGLDKKTRNIALIGLGLNFIGFALLLTLLNFVLGPKVSVDYSNIDHYLPP